AIRIPSDAELQAALTAANAVPVTEWVDASSGRALMEHPPAAAAVVSRRAIDALGVTVVKFANGVEAWLKPTDFKNDQVLLTLDAPGRTSLAPAADYPEATPATGFVDLSGAGALQPADLQKVLAGNIASARLCAFLSS